VEGESPDTLVMESTYGNRVHPKEDVRALLAKVIRDTIERGGSIVVPAFAVERTQKLLFILKDMMNTGLIPQIPVFVDSPMAIQAVQIFLKHQEEFTEETKQLIKKCGSPLEWQGVTFAAKQEESRKINDVRYPCIIISSSGMVTGGRILHHLIHRLSDPRNTVIFIGFQSPGTRGAAIKAGAKTVKMFGEEVAVRAQVVAFEQFSDHADTAELLQWLATFKKTPNATYLVHGEPPAATALQAAISEKMRWRVEVARWLEKVDIQ
jgi:metallo-beta-lactamase family protein